MLDAVSEKDWYPLLRMDECICSFGDATVFSTVDANTSYRQVDVEEVEIKQTTIISQFRLYRFTRMSSGLRKAFGTFQGTTDVTLSSVKCQKKLLYICTTLRSSQRRLLGTPNTFDLYSLF